MKSEFSSSDVEISTDPMRIDRDAVFDYLHNRAYWCKGIPFEILMTALDNSLPFSVFFKKQFCGFARLVTDGSTFAYLCDVFILEEFRGKGLGKILAKTVSEWIVSRNIRTALLLTRDAQALYTPFGWMYFDDITRIMRYGPRNNEFYQSTH
jgi:GNAT superfamily N-acetyltransferase